MIFINLRFLNEFAFFYMDEFYSISLEEKEEIERKKRKTKHKFTKPYNAIKNHGFLIAI